MNASRLCLLGCLAVGLAACTGCPPANSSGPPAASNKEKIVGKWELVKSDQGWPAGAAWEFGKDGKATVDFGGGAKGNGSYEVNGDALKWTPEGKDAVPLTIKTLTDDKLVVADDKGKTNEFKKQGGASPASYKDQVVHRWELTKSDTRGGWVGDIIEFTADGQRKWTFKDQDGYNGGNYTIDGDKVTMQWQPKIGGETKEEKFTIKSLTDKALVLVDEQGQTHEFKSATWAEKVVGVWEVTKGDIGTLNVGDTVVLGPDGALTITSKQGDQTTTQSGSYSVDGRMVTMNVNRGDSVAADKRDILILTDGVLVWQKVDDGADPFKRVARAAEEHWSAIAYSKSTTAFGYGVDHPNADEANKDALGYMDPNLKDIEIVATFNSGWAAIVVGKDDHYAILTGKEGGNMTDREIKELVRDVVEQSKKAKGVEEGRVVLLLHAKGFLMQHPYAAPEGDHFAAIARSDDGASWGSYGTEDEAKNLRNDDAKARRVVSKNGWCAMAEGDSGWGLGAADTEDDAKNAALADAKKHAKNPRVILTQSSDGGYTRYPSGGFGGGAAAH